MKAAAAKHKEEVGELKAKIQWYIDNQALITQNDLLIANQQAAIADLQSKLDQALKVQV